MIEDNVIDPLSSGRHCNTREQDIASERVESTEKDKFQKADGV